MDPIDTIFAFNQNGTEKCHVEIFAFAEDDDDEDDYDRKTGE